MRPANCLLCAVIGAVLAMTLRAIGTSGMVSLDADPATDAAWDDMVRTSRDSLPAYRARLERWRRQADELERAIAE